MRHRFYTVVGCRLSAFLENTPKRLSRTSLLHSPTIRFPFLQHYVHLLCAIVLVKFRSVWVKFLPGFELSYGSQSQKLNQYRLTYLNSHCGDCPIPMLR